MATATQVLHTPEELLTITDRPMPELIDGQFVDREPMGQKADAIAARIVYQLVGYSIATLPGVVNGSQGSFQVFPNAPNKVRIPDVSFTRKDRLPNGEPAEGHGKVAPDLIVEVISPRDSAVKLRKKIRDFLAAGVRMIWVVNPETRDIEVIWGDGTAILLDDTRTIDGGDVMPGLSCRVADLFPDA